MKVVIHNTETGMYFKSPGQWVKNRGDAFVFTDKSTAIKFLETHYLPNTKIVRESPGADGDGLHPGRQT